MKVDLFVREIAKVAFPDDLYSQTGFAFHLQIEFENFIKKFQLNIPIGVKHSQCFSSAGTFYILVK